MIICLDLRVVFSVTSYLKAYSLWLGPWYRILEHRVTSCLEEGWLSESPPFVLLLGIGTCLDYLLPLGEPVYRSVFLEVSPCISMLGKGTHVWGLMLSCDSY